MMFQLRLALIALAVLVVTGCNQAAQNNQNSTINAPLPPKQTLPKACKQSVQVQDIWKLEPILIKNGKIKENMTKAEKETVIREYIRKKNQHYQLCSKGK